ncbi:hypothetical protein CB1_000849010 [Camelus ferus]|nr:hypothetical protein CB1_000849010 [Camelus ferus]
MRQTAAASAPPSVPGVTSRWDREAPRRAAVSACALASRASSSLFSLALSPDFEDGFEGLQGTAEAPLACSLMTPATFREELGAALLCAGRVIPGEVLGAALPRQDRSETILHRSAQTQALQTVTPCVWTEPETSGFRTVVKQNPVNSGVFSRKGGCQDSTRGPGKHFADAEDSAAHGSVEGCGCRVLLEAPFYTDVLPFHKHSPGQADRSAPSHLSPESSCGAGPVAVAGGEAPSVHPQVFRSDRTTPPNRPLEPLAAAWGLAAPGVATSAPLPPFALGALTVESQNVDIGPSFLPELTQGNCWKTQIAHPEIGELSLERATVPASEQSRA